ncbi:putative leucine-rich repeat-containing protein DDB_G0290503 [Cydia pomonella]|uniref:putative leucine-rich repeat-containing protein DDB_G0290503 n=1 Tax=Cydia pomonella TaxID=82600 RepID=UPI002ADDC4CA|nr:putative leucine-rich repeat-containing protein DDB_G0290503 [Cydia pomonella]
MGNAFSPYSAREGATDVISESETMSDSNTPFEDAQEFHDTIDNDEARVKAKQEEMDEFRKQLSLKREQRKLILARHRAEKEQLEKSLEEANKAKLVVQENNRMLRDLLTANNIEIPENLKASDEISELSGAIASMAGEFEALKSSNNKLRRDLTDSNMSLQHAYSEIADLNAQNTESMTHINALKEVITVSKTMINLREQQLNELKDKLREIEQSLADREANMLSADLRQEYERQLQNIRTLRGLYEERARLAEVTRQGLARELEEQKQLKQAESNKNAELTTKVTELETTVTNLEETLENKIEQISSYQDETRRLQGEMSAVNKLFSQVLLGYKSKQDLDKLVVRLEENHGLLTHMAERDNGSEASSALPKLLLEIVSQVDEGEEGHKFKESTSSVSNEEPKEDVKTEETESQNPNTSAEEIVQNLPKVWRVLMELLSHQSEAESGTSEKVETCYKTVETKAGSVLVPSVSQTYIRLKDLIVEKLALIKEVNRMKQLNVHLETRLEEQERRLSLVTTELSKTWHVVGKLRRHHHQLHTHEKILKYELQQKRKLLNELKDELEYCREKWEQAREKNTQSERDWRKLRAEFTSRKTKSNSPSFNNSGESGYSDERPSDDSSESNDESEYVTEPLLRCKKKNKKAVEAILDSSADFNLVAEREDPASDMLDVAELPLDTQDDTSGLDASISISNNSENRPNNKAADETEDEVGEITNDSCNDDSSGIEHYCNSDYCCVGTSSEQDALGNDKLTKSLKPDAKPTSTTNIPLIDPAAILKSIKEQTERLAKKDERLNNLEKNSLSLLKKTQATDKLSKQIDGTLDHLLNRPSTSQNTESKEFDFIKKGKPTITELENEDCNEVQNNDDNKIDNSQQTNLRSEPTKSENDEKTPQLITNILGNTCENTVAPCLDDTNINLPSTSSNVTSIDTNIPEINAESIHESIRQQDERLARRDERLQKLEEGCSEVVNNISDTLKTGEDINTKLDQLHDMHQKKTNEEAGTFEDKSVPEPSTSAEIDHEARFAARDLRLKRLEEQTKSLVNKVNKTTSKGVKIHYKLEELHNIYGSESSRAGTPSDDTEDKPTNDEENTEQ